VVDGSRYVATHEVGRHYPARCTEPLGEFDMDLCPPRVWDGYPPVMPVMSISVPPTARLVGVIRGVFVLLSPDGPMSLAP
jgi:hypothetical protein